MLINQVVDSEKSLSYRYQAPHWPPGAAPLTEAAAQPSGPVRIAEVRPLSAPLASAPTAATATPLPPRPVTLQIPIVQEAKQRVTALAAAATPSTLVLRIDGVQLRADRGAVVQVFLNRPDVTGPAQGPEPGYLGNIVVVPSTGARTLGPQAVITRNFGFPLSQEQAAAVTDKDNLSVTLVPVTGATAPGEVLRYRQVYLASR
jgi:hypothetical protein